MDKAGPGPSTPTSGDPDHPEGLTGPLPTASGESPQLEAASSPSSRKPASGVGRAILRNLGALREHFLCREEGKPQVEAAPTGSGPGGSEGRRAGRCPAECCRVCCPEDGAWDGAEEALADFPPPQTHIPFQELMCSRPMEAQQGLRVTGVTEDLPAQETRA